MASSKLDFPRFLPAPSCRSIVVIRLGSLFKSELRTLLLNSGNPQSGLDHFLNSGLQGSPKFTRAQRTRQITKIEQSLCTSPHPVSAVPAACLLTSSRPQPCLDHQTPYEIPLTLAAGTACLACGTGPFLPVHRLGHQACSAGDTGRATPLPEPISWGGHKLSSLIRVTVALQFCRQSGHKLSSLSTHHN